ncbi:transposase (putative), gypsy type [Artemisia annua]|uniref:Transposase (Putative), gypsy type n=1 Tax=Artemisia annua TaxID=35608 RepID=A0A2U1PYE5_ARTAN|nr:transposase (putative), gypsy type [Artemisia annua]
MAVDHIDHVYSKMDQGAVDEFCKRYNIPGHLLPEAPGSRVTIRNAPEGKIGVYTRFFELGNFRIPLSRFLLTVLEYYQIHLSQLSVLAACRVSHFEILCRVHGGIPTLSLFRKFYWVGVNNGWMTIEKRKGPKNVVIPVCYTAVLDSVKHWKDHFFFIKKTIFPLSIPWFEKVSVDRDPPPSDASVNQELLKLLITKRGPFKKYPDVFLNVVGLSRT